MARDPIRAHQREAASLRRTGEDAKCACGEARPDALIAGSNPVACTQCRRKEQGKSIMDNHHVAGRANSLLTISIPANDHRAELSTAQYDWPRKTLENPDPNELLKRASFLRGFIDTNQYLVNSLLRPIPELLEELAEQLRKKGESNAAEEIVKHTPDSGTRLSDRQSRRTQPATAHEAMEKPKGHVRVRHGNAN